MHRDVRRRAWPWCDARERADVCEWDVHSEPVQRVLAVAVPDGVRPDAIAVRDLELPSEFATWHSVLRVVRLASVV